MSLIFSGAEQITMTTPLAGTGNFTLMIRAKVAPGATGTLDVVSEWQTSNRQSFRLYWNNGQWTAMYQYSYLFLIFTNYGTISSVGPTGGTTDSWHHLAVTFTNKTLTLYIDGVPMPSSSFSDTALVPTSNTIGASRTGTSAFGNYFRGELRDYRLYPYAMDPNVIQTIASINGHDEINDSITFRSTMIGPNGMQALALDDVSTSGRILAIPTLINFG